MARRIGQTVAQGTGFRVGGGGVFAGVGIAGTRIGSGGLVRLSEATRAWPAL